MTPHLAPRVRRAFFSLPLLVGAAMASPLVAQDLRGAVVIGDDKIEDAPIRRALIECAKHAPDLETAICLDRYWAPRWLLDREAAARNLREAQGTEHTHADILHAHLHEVLAETAPQPSDKEVDEYISSNQRDFEKPLRIRIFRIFVATEDDARSLIKGLSATTTVADFRKLAREHSLDRATNERGGDIGFVWPDGSTDIPQVSAEKSLYDAALPLQDGEFSQEPVAEGKRFAVLWRRGSLPAVERNEESRKLATARLREAWTENELQKMLEKLRGQVKGRDSLLLGKLRRKEATLFQEP